MDTENQTNQDKAAAEASAAVADVAQPDVAALGSIGRVLPSRAGEPPAQLPGESARDYSAFVYYFRLRPTTAQKQLAAALGMGENRLSEAKRQWRWDARIAEHLMQTGREQEHSEEWLKRREEVRRLEWDLHWEMIELGREGMQRYLASDKVPSLGDLTNLIELATRLARLAAGMPWNRTELSGEEGGPIRIDFEAALNKVYGPRASVVEVGATDVKEITQRGGGSTADELTQRGDSSTTDGHGSTRISEPEINTKDANAEAREDPEINAKTQRRKDAEEETEVNAKSKTRNRDQEERCQ